MTERRNYYAVDTGFPFFAAAVYRSLGFVGRCSLAWINALNTEIVNKVLFDQRSGVCVVDELVGLPSDIWLFMDVVGKSFAPHCSSGLYMLTFGLWTILWTIYGGLEACQL